MKINKASILLFFSTLLILTGCVNPICTLHEADHNVAKNACTIQQVKMRSAIPTSPVKSFAGYYVNPQPMPLKSTPAWTQQHITVHAQNVPLNFVVSRILRDHENIAVDYLPGTDQNEIVSINYSGPIKGALNQLAADTNYAYTPTDNGLVWQEFITKTFNISFMPGTSSYQVGKNEGYGSGQATSNTNSGSTSGTNAISNVTGELGQQEYSNLKGNLSVWDDLKQTLNQLKSNDGHVYVSEATTTITVQDHPANVNAIENYINQLNRDLSREVAIQVEVLQIDLNKEFNYGINWDVVLNSLGTEFGIAGQLGNAANIAGAATQGTSVQNSLAVFQIGSLNGSHALINALSQQGKISVVTQPRVVTMNNQMAEIRITRDVSYLQSVSNTTLANAGSANVTTSLTPGIVTDGFTLYLLPKIQNSKVYLQISSSLSTLTALNTVTNNPSASASSGLSLNLKKDKDKITGNDDNNPQFQAIQVPTLANQTFNQRSVVSSGCTLVVAGFQQLRDETQRSQLAGIQPLGGLGAERKNVQTIVLITPTILAKM